MTFRFDSDNAPEVIRYDAGSIGAIEETPTGGIRVQAFITKPGVFEYIDEVTGKTVVEYRPPEEVYDPASLASWADVPVTDEHPRDLINAETWQRYARGHVREAARKDAETDRAATSVAIQDAALIRAIRSGRKEVSGGYRMRIDRTPGVSPPEYGSKRYDQVQRMIRGNHLAVTRKARLGSDIALRLDSAGSQIVESEGSQDPGLNKPSEGIAQMKSVRLDGVEYGLNSPAEIDVYIAALARAEKARTDSAASAKTELDQAQARADAAESKVATLEKEITDLKDPKRLDSAVSARVAIVSKAQKVLGTEERFDGLTNRQVQEKTIAKADPSLKTEGRSDDYVSAIFDVIGTPAKRADAATQIATGTAPRADAVEAPKTGRAAMLESNAKAASQPLAMSK